MLDKLDLKVRFRRKSFGRRKPRKLSIVQIMFFFISVSEKCKNICESRISSRSWEVGGRGNIFILTLSVLTVHPEEEKHI